MFVRERLSTKAILETLKAHERDEQMELQLFGDPRLSLAQQLEAYEHMGDWVNRLILGDSLVMMNSLLEYERLGGQVQMIYIDLPSSAAGRPERTGAAREVQRLYGRGKGRDRETTPPRWRDGRNTSLANYTVVMRCLMCWGMNEQWPDDPLIREILQQEWSGEAARRPFLKAFSLWAMAVSENPSARDFLSSSSSRRSRLSHGISTRSQARRAS